MIYKNKKLDSTFIEVICQRKVSWSLDVYLDIHVWIYALSMSIT